VKKVLYTSLEQYQIAPNELTYNIYSTYNQLKRCSILIKVYNNIIRFLFKYIPQVFHSKCTAPRYLLNGQV